MATQAEQQATGWDELPAGTALVRTSNALPELASPQEVAAYVREFDEQVFLAQVMGEAIGKWFYSFKIQGKTVEGVSVVGAEEFARLRAMQGFPIRFPPGSISAHEVTRNGKLGIEITVIARDARTGAEGLGMAFYPYMVERERNGQRVEVPDNHPDRKCLSVAKRNAILDLVPQATILSVLKARETIVKANEDRKLGEARQAFKSLPQVKARTVRQGERQDVGDPYGGPQAPPEDYQNDSDIAASGELPLGEPKRKPRTGIPD